MRLTEFIRANLNGPPTLSSCAAYAGYSSTYFSKHFKRMMGVSFKAFVDLERAAAAKQLLLGGSTVTETAAALCYDSAYLPGLQADCRLSACRAAAERVGCRKAA